MRAFPKRRMALDQLKGRPRKNGRILPGETCAYTDKCVFKHSACNGLGCPICDGKTTDVEFSCASARLMKIIEGPGHE